MKWSEMYEDSVIAANIARADGDWAWLKRERELQDAIEELVRLGVKPLPEYDSWWVVWEHYGSHSEEGLFTRRPTELLKEIQLLERMNIEWSYEIRR